MAGLSVRTRIYPYRLKMQDKDPMQLSIEITNEDINSKIVSFQLKLPESIATDRGGINRFIQKNIQSLRAGETQKFDYNLYPTKRATEGDFNGKLIVSEHYQSFDYVQGNISKTLTFRITR